MGANFLIPVRMFRRFAGAVTVLLVLAQCVPPSLAAPMVANESYPEGFLPENLSFILTNLQENHVIGNKDTFLNEPTLPRAQALAMIMRATNVQVYNNTMPVSGWKDVPANAWFAQNVAAATRLGLVTMPDDGLFHADRPVTRGEFITLLYRMDTATIGDNTCCTGNESKYSDVKPWDWFFTASTWARTTFLSMDFVNDSASDIRYSLPDQFKGNEMLSRSEAAMDLYLYTHFFKIKGSVFGDMPFGDLTLPDRRMLYTQDGIAFSSTFTGKAPALKATGKVYKEMPDATSMVGIVPETILKEIPNFGKTGILSSLSLFSQTMPGLSVSTYEPDWSLHLNWDTSSGAAPLPTGTSTGEVMKFSNRVFRKLGIDTAKFGTQTVDGTNSLVSYNRDLDGLQVVDEFDGTPFANLSVSFDPSYSAYYAINLYFQHILLGGDYPLLSWDEVMQQLHTYDETYDYHLGFDGNSVLTYNDNGEAVLTPLRALETRYDTATEVMGRFDREITQPYGNATDYRTFYLPSIRFSGESIGIREDGTEMDLGPTVRVIPLTSTLPEQSDTSQQ